MDYQGILNEVESLPVDERIRLIEEVRDGLPDEDYEPELSDDLKALLDRRIAALEADPTNVVTWDEVKARIMSSYSAD